jgi:hypothetical protein
MQDTTPLIKINQIIKKASNYSKSPFSAYHFGKEEEGRDKMSASQPTSFSFRYLQ